MNHRPTRRLVLAVTASSGLTLGGCLDWGSGGSDRLNERGTIEIVVDDEPVDLTADRFQSEHADDYALAFHLHQFDEYWYMEGTSRVTVAEAIDHLPHHAFDDESLTIDGESYELADPAVTVTYTVDGEPVDPQETELHDGDHLALAVETDG